MEPTRGRQYKSRKSRPCDFCRNRKSACHMEHGPPCQLCKEKQRTCTFVQVPGQRKRPRTNRATTSPTNGTTTNGGVAEPSLADKMSTFPSPSHAFNSTYSALYDGQPMQSPSINALLNSENLLYDPFADFEIAYGQGDYSGLPVSSMSIHGNNQSPNVTVPHHGMSSHSISSGGADASRTQGTASSRGSSVLAQQFTSTRQPASPKADFTDRGSLDAVSNFYYRLIGLTGELDLYVLSHRSYDHHDESNVRYAGLKYRRMSSNQTPSNIDQSFGRPPESEEFHPPPVFTLINNDLMANAEPRMEQSMIDSLHAELRTLINEALGHRLTLLFAHFIQPSFPILAAHQIPSDASGIAQMPPALLATISAMAIPFITYDDELSIHLPQAPSPTRLFQLAWWLVCQEFHSPRLSTIQTCLLLLQRHATNPYVPNSPFKQSLMSITVALSQHIGLHRDPSTWRTLPAWEKRLRKRIWWAVWMMEKWITLGEAVPSSLHNDDSDVEPLTSGDMVDCVPDFVSADCSNSHFIHLTTLTTILSDITNTYFTVRSAAKTSNNLQISLEAARPLRARLKQWHDNLPGGLRQLSSSSSQAVGSRSSPRFANQTSFCTLNVNGSFHLAYIITQMTLFRALLRPVNKLSRLWTPSSDPDSNEMGFRTQVPAEDIDGSKAVIVGALAWVKDAVELAENLRGSEWDAFWHSWSRANFGIVSCIILNLLLVLRPSPLRNPNSTTSNVSPTSPTSAIPSRPQPNPARGQQQQQQQQSAPEQPSPTSHQQPHSEDHAPVDQEHLPPNITTSFLHLQDSYTEILDYMTRWRWIMKISSRGAGGRKGLMNLSLLRIDAMVAELGG